MIFIKLCATGLLFVFFAAIAETTPYSKLCSAGRWIGGTGFALIFFSVLGWIWFGGLPHQPS